MSQKNNLDKQLNMYGSFENEYDDENISDENISDEEQHRQENNHRNAKKITFD
jgi:hypothetical protein